MVIVTALSLFSHINLTAPGSEPIVRLLREIPSALKFVLDHPLDHMKSVGITTASICTVRRVGNLPATTNWRKCTNVVSFAIADLDSEGVRYENEPVLSLLLSAICLP